MLSEKMVSKLNDQLGIEFFSSNIYLQMSAWSDSQGLENCASFFREHAAEEMLHMNKMFDYMCEKGSMPVLSQIGKPQSEYTSIHQVFEAAFQHEKYVTGTINDLVSVAYDEKDWASFNYLQWFVAEQVEEEALFSKVLDKLKLIGTGNESLYFIDQEIGNFVTGAAAASAC